GGMRTDSAERLAFGAGGVAAWTWPRRDRMSVVERHPQSGWQPGGGRTGALCGYAEYRLSPGVGRGGRVRRRGLPPTPQLVGLRRWPRTGARRGWRGGRSERSGHHLRG